MLLNRWATTDRFLKSSTFSCTARVIQLVLQRDPTTSISCNQAASLRPTTNWSTDLQLTLLSWVSWNLWNSKFEHRFRECSSVSEIDSVWIGHDWERRRKAFDRRSFVEEIQSVRISAHSSDHFHCSSPLNSKLWISTYRNFRLLLKCRFRNENLHKSLNRCISHSLLTFFSPERHTVHT